jgi:hypothetical protein
MMIILRSSNMAGTSITKPPYLVQGFPQKSPTSHVWLPESIPLNIPFLTFVYLYENI